MQGSDFWWLATHSHRAFEDLRSGGNGTAPAVGRGLVSSTDHAIPFREQTSSIPCSASAESGEMSSAARNSGTSSWMYALMC